MSVSRILLALEALLLLAPVTALAGYFAVIYFASALPAQLHSEGISVSVVGFAGALVVSLLGLGSGWVLIVRFLWVGCRGLAATSLPIWWGAIIGGLLALFSWLAVLAGFSTYPGWLGLPAVVPLAHILLERARCAS